ncbi:MAG: hypothetical protein ABFQ53_02440 [Patescibacteria group bacterium]
MVGQGQNSENKSSEHVSLEERFGITDDDFSRELNEPRIAQKKEMERPVEKMKVEEDDSYQKILDKAKTQNDDDDEKHDEKTLMQDASTLHQQDNRESQLTHLVDLAMVKGIPHAVKVAQKAEDYYLLDQLHDNLLSEDLHDKLMTAGLIE